MTNRISCLMAITILASITSGCTDHEAEWRAFQAQHHCKIIDRQAGSTSMIMTHNGSGVSMIPIQHQGLSTYQCDDQVISRRED